MSFTALRVAAIVWNLALIALIGSAKLSTANVGAFLWGPTMDFWSASIAISDIEFGLKGKLGYREVVQKFADHLSTTKSDLNVVDEGTRRLVGQPDLVDRAIKAAAVTKREELKSANIEDGGYVTMWADDTGYSDFFQLAFRIFGYSAFSTHYLYVSILTLSFVIFALVYRSTDAALAIVTLAVSGLFLVTSSSIFDASTPSYACHRFLGTLALIPCLHLLMATIENRPVKIVDFLALAAQTILLSFVASARSSAGWCIFAYFAICAVVLLMRSHSALSDLFRFMRDLWRRQVLTIEIRKNSDTFRLKWMAGIVAIMLAIISVVQTNRLDRIYFSDAVMPYHMRWHALFVGLAFHPSWPERKPYPEAAIGDDIGYVVYERYVAAHGLPRISKLNGGFQPARLYEAVVRNEFLRFAVKNPVYMIALSFYYKPKVTMQLIDELLKSLRWQWFLLMVPSFIVATALLLRPSSHLRVREVSVAIAILWVFAMLPSIVAYPARHAMGDLLWSSLFLGSALISGAMVVVMRHSVVGRLIGIQDRTGKLESMASLPGRGRPDGHSTRL